jgi:geranylgeranyl pyrophosphate synthase
MSKKESEARINVEKMLEEKAKLIDKTIEKYVPREFTKDSLVFSLQPPRYDYNLVALNEAVAKPIWDFLDRGGKRWRPSLFLLIAEALGRNPDELLDFAIIPEVVHNGTIMTDDIEDNSELRRGKPCTHRLFGLDVAVNVASAMYYLPLLVLLKNRDSLSTEKLSKIYHVYVQEMINLSFGQAMDIAWHKDLADADKVSESQYMQMCAYKTGTLARMAAKMAAILSDASEDTVERLGGFAEAVGIAFQIQDDVLDLVKGEFAEKKGGRGQDITEGKRSLIIIHALENAKPTEKKRVIEILAMHTSNPKLKEEAIRIMEKYDSINYAKKSAQNLVAESWKGVDKLLLPSKAKNKLRAFARYLIERKI